MVNDVLKDLQGSFDKAIDSFKRELSKVRTGRANLALLDGIKVEYYGTMTPIHQVATLNVPDPRLITIKPWEKSLIPAIEKSIKAHSELGLNPSSDGELVRLPIDYYALVTLGGFIPVIDSLGGVDVHVDNAFCDPTYDEYGFTAGFSIKAGWHHLNGRQALAYARVRKASGESDFTRARRQQEVLSAVRDAVVAGRFLGDPVGLLKAVGRTVSTNVPRSRVSEFLDHATRIDRATTYRGVLVGNDMVRSGYDGRGYVLLPDLPRVRAYALSLFPTDGTLPAAGFQSDVEERSDAGSGSFSSGVAGCRPAATQKPSPKPSPTASPSASPSASGSPEPTPSPSPSPEPTPPPSPSPSPEPPPSPSPEGSPSA